MIETLTITKAHLIRNDFLEINSIIWFKGKR